jgi:hypothetical protein
MPFCDSLGTGVPCLATHVAGSAESGRVGGSRLVRLPAGRGCRVLCPDAWLTLSARDRVGETRHTMADESNGLGRAPSTASFLPAPATGPIGWFKARTAVRTLSFEPWLGCRANAQRTAAGRRRDHRDLAEGRRPRAAAGLTACAGMPDGESSLQILEITPIKIFHIHEKSGIVGKYAV